MFGRRLKAAQGIRAMNCVGAAMEMLEGRRLLSAAMGLEQPAIEVKPAVGVVGAVVFNLSPVIENTTLPTQVLDGTIGTGNATLKITNNSAVKFNAVVRLNVYASATGTLETGALTIGIAQRHLEIDPGQSAPVTMPIRVRTGILGPGTFTTVAQISSSSEGVSAAVAGPAFTVIPRVIALSEVVDNSTLPTEIPTSVLSNTARKGVLTVIVTNSGTIAASGLTKLNVYASRNQATDSVSGDTLVRSLRLKLGLKPNATRTLLIPIGKAPALPLGTYYGVVQLTDAQGNYSAAASEQSVTVVAPVMALATTISSVTPVTLSGTKAQVVTETVTLTNTGNVVSGHISDPRSFVLTFGLVSESGTVTIADLIAKDSVVRVLAAGATKTVRYRFSDANLIKSLPGGGEYFPTVSVVEDRVSLTAATKGTELITVG